jgi:hypothetical protein
VVDGIASAHDGVLKTERFPRQSDAGFDGRLVEVDTNFAIAAFTISTTAERYGTRDQIFLRFPVKVRLLVQSFGNRSHERPRHAQVQGQGVRNAPVVLDKGTEHLPTPSGHRTIERLVVNRTKWLPNEQIRGTIAGCVPAKQEIPVLEAVGHDIHLIEPNADADTNIVATANHVKGIAE